MFAVSALAVVTLTVAFVSSSSNSCYWYVDGLREDWFSQDDVFAFKTNDQQEFRGYIDNGVVAKMDVRKDHGNLHLVYFKTKATDWERQTQIREIVRDDQFDKSYPVITKFSSAPNTENLWYVADDQVLITFRAAQPDREMLEHFQMKYGLTPINDPSKLPAGGTYSYVFQWDAKTTGSSSTVDLACKMWLQDSLTILNAEPGLLKIYDGYTSTDEPELNTGGADKFYVVNFRETQLQAFFNINSTAGKLHFRVFDLFGRDFIDEPIESEDTQVMVDISNLPAGIYFSCIARPDGSVVVSQRFRKL